jgi:MYXO-CTERM domain-containing protein
MIFALLLTLPGVAQEYSFPTSPADYGAFYVTAYRDDGGQDWACRQGHYTGHTGTDFGCGSWACMDVGRPATAAADGVVIAAADGEFDRCTTADCGAGNYVKLEHADGRETWYWHLKQWSVVVQVGDTVRCGDKLGEIGSSGNSLGPHLHFGATNTRGDHVDPFEGPCSAFTGAWVDQGVYDDLPALTCEGGGYLTDAAAFARLHAARSTDIDGDGRADAVVHDDAGWSWFAGADAGLADAHATGLGAPTDDDPLRWTRWVAADVDGDALTDLCERGGTRVVCHLAVDGFTTTLPGPAWGDDAGLGLDPYASTLRAGDLDGDGRDDLCLRTPDGVRCAVATPDGFAAPFVGPELSDDLSWDDVDNYGTLLLGDIDGDGGADLCARANVGMRCYRFRDGAFGGSIAGPAWSEDLGWSAATHWASITLEDVDADGRADLCGRTAAGWDCHLSTGDGFGEARPGPRWADTEGWNDPTNAWTFRLGDLDGDGDLDLCARANAGIRCALWDGITHSDRIDGPAWSDDDGWDTLARSRSIRLADVTGDGLADLCGVDEAGLVCHASTGASFGPPLRAEGAVEAEGGLFLAGPACGDRDGDGRADCRPAAPETPPAVLDTGEPGSRDGFDPGVSVFPGRICGCDGAGSGGKAPALLLALAALLLRRRRCW